LLRALVLRAREVLALLRRVVPELLRLEAERVVELVRRLF
jgi:hypothetical protein